MAANTAISLFIISPLTKPTHVQHWWSTRVYTGALSCVTHVHFHVLSSEHTRRQVIATWHGCKSRLQFPLCGMPNFMRKRCRRNQILSPFIYGTHYHMCNRWVPLPLMSLHMCNTWNMLHRYCTCLTHMCTHMFNTHASKYKEIAKIGIRSHQFYQFCACVSAQSVSVS